MAISPTIPGHPKRSNFLLVTQRRLRWQGDAGVSERGFRPIWAKLWPEHVWKSVCFHHPSVYIYIYIYIIYIYIYMYMYIYIYVYIYIYMYIYISIPAASPPRTNSSSSLQNHLQFAQPSENVKLVLMNWIFSCCNFNDSTTKKAGTGKYA